MSFQGYGMRFPIIRVLDKDYKREHIVGTDSHDTLYIGNDGQIHYRNLQNSEGTGKRGSYAFKGVKNKWSLYTEIEFVSLDDLIEIIKEQAKLSAERERILRETMRHIFKDFDDEVEQSKQEGFFHT